MDINLANFGADYLDLIRNDQGKLKADLQSKDEKKLLHVCQQFEAIFIRQMLKEMRKTIPKDGMFPESNERSFYTSMFDEKVADTVAENGRIGLADMLFKQMSPRYHRIEDSSTEIKELK
ncbi:rod-binding protein [bacterium]|nr:rod-binding protein [FCB group bacterium]MBL7190148.1 rod-binding protein [bacterium]